MILSNRSRVTQLLFRDKHISLGHCGPTLLLSVTGTRLHVLGVKKLARSVCRSCVACRKAQAQTRPQMMGQLPQQRVTRSSTFAICGIDYARPFLMKKGHTRRPVFVSTYVAVFVCFATKAAHLEAVSDATTEAFLACLRRFVSRRGLPSEIHTDNGGNFKGAKRDLQDLYAFLEKTANTSQVSNYLLQDRIQWHSIPERAPHFGGLWEATAKMHVIGKQKLTYEEFSTVLCQVESCLNSRPLVAMTSHSPDGIQALTPGHFLINQELCALPETPIAVEPSLLKRWNMCQAMVQQFWTRWSLEYLHQLQRLQKWRKPTPNLKIGDVVVIRDDQLFTNHWPLGRVIQTYPGNDGLVRTALIKTATSTLKRPVTNFSAEDNKEFNWIAALPSKEQDCKILYRIVPTQSPGMFGPEAFISAYLDF